MSADDQRAADGPDTELAAAIDWFTCEPETIGRKLDDIGPYAATIVRAYLARPAAGRDLTAQDVAAVGQRLLGQHRSAEQLADDLNRIARPAVARTDGQPRTGADLADQRRRERETGTGPLRDDPLSTAERMGAAPADDTAAPDRAE